mmetsp:Transcript_9681/g.28583  ORF Transcript_9681/g.28583 Transcript_9681/m.28583 type:complete len:223 (+) Transcript_9681:78-746(+)
MGPAARLTGPRTAMATTAGWIQPPRRAGERMRRPGPRAAPAPSLGQLPGGAPRAGSRGASPGCRRRPPPRARGRRSPRPASGSRCWRASSRRSASGAAASRRRPQPCARASWQLKVAWPRRSERGASPRRACWRACTTQSGRRRRRRNSCSNCGSGQTESRSWRWLLSCSSWRTWGGCVRRSLSRWPMHDSRWSPRTACWRSSLGLTSVAWKMRSTACRGVS